MKKIFLIPFILFCISSCKKSTPVPPVNTALCSPTKLSTNPGGGSTVIEYNTEGSMTGFKNYTDNILQVTTIVGSNIVQSSYTSSAGFPIVQTTDYVGNIVTGYPDAAHVSQTEGLITRTRIVSYGFEYDGKSRLKKVIEQTQYVMGDWEYDLYILYNDQDNVTGIRYERTTGPYLESTIAATGYDDKKNPYSESRQWKYIVSWDGNDPVALFMQLSKNNPLGYTMPDGSKKTITYTYDDKGYPMTQTSVNTVTSGGTPYTSITSFEYQCK